jgi:hypothetical protein
VAVCFTRGPASQTLYLFTTNTVTLVLKYGCQSCSTKGFKSPKVKNECDTHTHICLMVKQIILKGM